ncbi:hypothetical protein A33Q_4102 [Indibacter alkaliphilus LW1]|uniref:Methyltransferase type 11 domain-containing protein n=2 Tax=Indibacter TaxID=647744 RepID=S2CZG8_INDAL|nr:hypothetical protein A33Q_4102 [Indibacter alkaliphilus LW1]
MASSDQPESLGYALRNRRFQVFEDLIDKNFPASQVVHILDVGGTAYFWEDKNMVLEGRVKVTLLNLEEEHNLPFGVNSISGDATDLSQFDDNSFDLVFSNSVIEHLYTWKNQKKMATECMRVGKKYFVQTPNKHFLVEAHYALPLIQYAPKSLAFMVLTKTKISRMRKWREQDAKQYLEEIRLINEKEMKKLFPEASIYKEKWLGMTKSFTAHNL